MLLTAVAAVGDENVVKLVLFGLDGVSLYIFLRRKTEEKMRVFAV